MNVASFKNYIVDSKKKIKQGEETRISVLVSKKNPEITFLYDETRYRTFGDEKYKVLIYSFMDHATDVYHKLHVFAYQKKIVRSEVRVKDIIIRLYDRKETIEFLKDFFP